MSISGEDAWGTRESRDHGGESGGIAMRDIGDERYSDRDRNSSVWAYDGDVSTPTHNPLFTPPADKEELDKDLEGDGLLTHFDEYVDRANIENHVKEARMVTTKTLAFKGKDKVDAPIGRFTLRETLRKEEHIVKYLGDKARGLNGRGGADKEADKQKLRGWSVGTKREVRKLAEGEEENFRRVHGVSFLEEFGLGCSLYLKSIEAFLLLSIFTFVMSLPAIGIFLSGEDPTEKGIIVVTDVVPHRLSLGHCPKNLPGVDREWLIFTLSLIDALSWLIWFIGKLLCSPATRRSLLSCVTHHNSLYHKHVTAKLWESYCDGSKLRKLSRTSSSPQRVIIPSWSGTFRRTQRRTR